MKLFGLEIGRAIKTKGLSAPYDGGSGGWFPVIREGFAGAWQRNVSFDRTTSLSFHAVWACITLISHDISKLRVKLIQQQSDGTWQEITNPAYSPVLRDPNDFQHDHQFWEVYILSKLVHGNTYVLKRRDNRNVVTDLYVLDAARVKPLVADDGSVFYELNADNLSGVGERIVVPAREMIHDRWNCLFHPLIGHSPIFAAGLAASQGLRIQHNSDAFFRNRAAPSGILTAPGHIEEGTARRLRELWNDNYSNENAGSVAVVGDNLKFQQLTMTAVDAQLVDQLKLSAEMVCGVFHVPHYKVGIGEVPVRTGIEALNLEYYTQALQKLIEDAEGCLDRALGLGPDIGVEFDIDALLRMDTAARVAAMKDAIGSGGFSPDEARKKFFDMGPTEGGDSPYLQQQNFSLQALAKRDALDNPFAAGTAVAPKSGSSPSAQQSADASAQSAEAAAAADLAGAAQANAALVEIYRGLA